MRKTHGFPQENSCIAGGFSTPFFYVLVYPRGSTVPSQVVNRCITDMAVFDFVTEGPEAPLAPSNIFGFAVFATTSLHLLTLFIKTLMLVLVLVLVVFCPFFFFMCFLFFLFLELIPGSDTFSSRLSGPDPTTCSSSSVGFLLILWEKKSQFYVDNTHVYGCCSYFCSLSSPCCCCSRCCFELSRQFVKMIRRMLCASKTLIPRQRLHVERCQEGLLIKDMTRLKIWL